jgi:hypothetical protein
VIRFVVRFWMLVLGVYVMYLEGQHCRTPGVWFAVAVILIVLALVPWRNRS